MPMKIIKGANIRLAMAVRLNNHFLKLSESTSSL